MVSEIKEILLNPLYLTQVGSVLVLISYMVKDFKLLRLSLIFANIFFLLPIVLKGAPLFQEGFWSFLFIAVNAQRLWVMHQEAKPIQLDKDQQLIFDSLFKHMKPKQFLRLYKKALQKTIVPGDLVVKKGDFVDDLMVLLSGEARAITEKATYFLSKGQFMGEMSFLTGKPASADVIAKEKTTYLYWPRKTLAKEFLRRNNLESEINASIGVDLTCKLQIPRVEESFSSAQPKAIKQSNLSLQSSDLISPAKTV